MEWCAFWKAEQRCKMNRILLMAAHQSMEGDEDKQAPGDSASTALVKARHSCGYDHSIIGQPNYQQHQDDHDLAQELQELAELEHIAVCAVGHLHVLLVQQRRHVRLDAETSQFTYLHMSCRICNLFQHKHMNRVYIRNG